MGKITAVPDTSVQQLELGEMSLAKCRPRFSNKLENGLQKMTVCAHYSLEYQERI